MAGLGPLANIPGYGGFAARRQQLEAENAQELQQAGVLQQLHARQQDAQEMQQMKGVVAQAGGDPQRAIEALLKHGTPKSIELASKLKGLVPEITKPVQPQLVTVVGPDGKPMQKWIRPGETTGTDVGLKYEKPETPKADTPVPVTPVTIQDPNDPSATIVIDGRTRAVLGKGPKLTQTGAADAKLEAEKPQAKLRVDSMIQGIDRLSSNLAELDAMPGLPNITGTLMGRTPNITNAATSAQAKLDSIKSQIFQSSLQAMREASKTGGAVGNVSDREGDKLERTIAALDQAQGTPSFRAELKKARAQLKISKELIERAYEAQFSGVQETPQRRASDKAAKPRVVDW